MWKRPAQYTRMVDYEHLVCGVGDLTHNESELVGWGVSTGRIREVDGTTVSLNGPVTLESGKTYKFQVRTSGNERVDASITNAAGTTDTLTLDAAIGAAGDLYVIGEVNKGLASLVIRRIERAGDTTAKLTMVDYAPDVLTADAGTPPPFTSQITGQPWCAPPDPPVVDIRFSDSAPDDGGIVHVQTGIST